MPNNISDNLLPKMLFNSKEEAYERILQAIVESYIYIDKSTDKENGLRDRIVYFLQNSHPFFAPLFQYELLTIIPEYYNFLSETEKSRSDICFSLGEVNGIIVGRFIIECKRLFQQPSKNTPYLDDGLIRFINLKYSGTNEYAGMIGFVVSGDINTIFSETITNTEKFHPSNPKRPVITPLSKNWQHSFISFHERINKENIQIYHLFFEFMGN